MKVITAFFCAISSSGISEVLAARNKQIRCGRRAQGLTLSAPTRVGDVLLPQGQYEVRHVMEADSHIMVFKQIGGKSAEARVKCNLTPLQQKVDHDQVVHTLNAANARSVLQTLRFSGGHSGTRVLKHDPDVFMKRGVAGTPVPHPGLAHPLRTGFGE